MLTWQIFLILSMIFLLIEIFVPMMFFLNFALGCLLTAAIAQYTSSPAILITCAVLLSLLSLAFLRPFLMNSKKQESGVEDKYIGKTAKVIEPVTQNSGAVTIYGERWEARSDIEIEIGAEVKIIKNESLVFYVQKI